MTGLLKSVPARKTLSFTLVLSFLILSRWLNSPCGSWGNTSAEYLQRAQAAFDQKNYQQAQGLLYKALAKSDPAAGSTQAHGIKIGLARAALARRYQQSDYAGSLFQLKPAEAMQVLEIVYKKIQEHFYPGISAPELWSQSFLQLDIALREPNLCLLHIKDAQAGGRLREKIQQLSCEIRKSNIPPERIFVQLEKFSVLSREAGLPGVWPVVETAYSLASSLDEYSYLLTPSEYQQMLDQFDGYYQGLGVDLIFSNDYPRVFDVVAASPADRAGIQPGDQVISIANIDCRGFSAEDFRKKLSQTVFRSVCLNRNNHLISCNVQGGLIFSPTIRQERLMDRESGMGYLRISSFAQHTPGEMEQVLEKLGQQGMQKLIIDLRNNGGGIVEAAVKTAAYFLPQKELLTVRSTGTVRRYNAEEFKLGFYGLPLVILVDENTASAAEIFAGALQDHQRATIIGDITYGKARVQTLIPLTVIATGLCFTTGCYETPGGRNLHGQGLIPDIICKNSAEILSSREMQRSDNPIMIKAMLVLSQQQANYHNRGNYPILLSTHNFRLN